MHGFKRIFFGIFFIYLTIISSIAFLESFFNFNENYLMNRLKDVDKINEKKIIVFGRSHCEFGVKSQIIELSTNIKSFNFCSSAYEYEVDILFEKLHRELNKDDVVLFAKRLPVIKQIDDSYVEKLIPNLVGRARFIVNYNSRNEEIISNRIKNQNNNGDLQNFRKLENFEVISYSKAKFKNINKNLKYQLNKIENSINENTPKIIVISPPILANQNDADTLKMIINKVDTKKFSNLTWIPPLILTEKKYFTDDDHVNEKGRSLWTDYLIKQLKKKI